MSEHRHLHRAPGTTLPQQIQKKNQNHSKPPQPNERTNERTNTKQAINITATRLAIPPLFFFSLSLSHSLLFSVEGGVGGCKSPHVSPPSHFQKDQFCVPLFLFRSDSSLVPYCSSTPPSSLLYHIAANECTTMFSVAISQRRDTDLIFLFYSRKNSVF